MSTHEEETPQISTLRYTSVKEDTPYLPINLAGLTRRAKRGSKLWLKWVQNFLTRLTPPPKSPPPPPGYLAENLQEFSYEIPVDQEWISRPSLAERRAAKVRTKQRKWLGVAAVIVAVPIVAMFRFIKPPAPPSIVLKPQVQATQVATKTEGSKAQLTATTRIDAIYIVEKGDCWGAIASRYGISATALAGANGHNPEDLLKVGERLKIPVGNGFIHIVREGETLSELLLRYGTTTKEFQRANGLVDINNLKIGQKLLFTGKGPAETGN